MPRTAINIVKLKGAVGDAQTAENPFTGSETDDHYWLLQERDVLVIENTGVASRTVDVEQVEDELGRGIAANTVTIPAGEFRFVGPLSSQGWAQKGASDVGRVFLTIAANGADLKFEVLRRN